MARWMTLFRCALTTTVFTTRLIQGREEGMVVAEPNESASEIPFWLRSTDWTSQRWKIHAVERLYWAKGRHYVTETPNDAEQNSWHSHHE
jgi:hypothetical protein